MVGEDGELLPVLKNYLSYQNTLRLNLESMGLRPQRPDPEPNLSDYLRQQTPPEPPEEALE
jgi:hypothetical protein